MKIIISPTMKMQESNESLPYQQLPVMLNDTQVLLKYLQKLNYDELQSIWKCSDKLAKLNYQRITRMDLEQKLTPAIFSFQGLQYQYIAADVFTYDELEYLEEHLRILSGFYGVLRPFDGVTPYRLEMKAKFNDWEHKSLYDFWEDRLSKTITSESNTILNLASKEYSDTITKYVDEQIKVITCVFGELIDGKVKQKGTLAKMARGEMVRFMSENQIRNIDQIKAFNRLSYAFKEDLSSESELVFVKET